MNRWVALAPAYPPLSGDPRSAAPLLITSTASEQDARSRLPVAYQNEDVIVRFRPNIHVDVKGQLPAYDEDNWSSLLVRSHSDEAQEVTIKCIFRTVRCLSLNVPTTHGPAMGVTDVAPDWAPRAAFRADSSSWRR